MNNLLFIVTLGLFAVSALAQTVTDIDGNVYQTVTIGNQTWMTENLKVTHYRNGDAILMAADNSQWANLINGGAYCNYNNDTSNTAVYGYLYNWFVVDDRRNLTPEGWHVASDQEWQAVAQYLGGQLIAGGKLKTTGTIDDGDGFWNAPNEGATNESGFFGQPAGYRYLDGTFFDVGNYGYFWTSSETSNDPNLAWRHYLIYDISDIYRNDRDKRFGFSIRCIQDAATSIDDLNTTPKSFNLKQNFPNPFNPATSIDYELADNSTTKLQIFNVLGQPIRTLVESFQNAGSYSVLWDGKDSSGQQVPSGIYFYQLKTNVYSRIMKMALLK